MKGRGNEETNTGNRRAVPGRVCARLSHAVVADDAQVTWINAAWAVNCAARSHPVVFYRPYSHGSLGRKCETGNPRIFLQKQVRRRFKMDCHSNAVGHILFMHTSRSVLEFCVPCDMG